MSAPTKLLVTSLVACTVVILGVDDEREQLDVKFYIDRAAELKKVKDGTPDRQAALDELLRRAFVWCAPLSVPKLDDESLPVLNEAGEPELMAISGKAAVAYCMDDPTIRGALFRALIEVRRVQMEKNCFGLLDSTLATVPAQNVPTNASSEQVVELIVASQEASEETQESLPLN